MKTSFLLIRKLLDSSLKHQKKQDRVSVDSGMTLMEVVVAIVILGVMVLAIAPAITISAATRVRSQDIELATQLAQGEVDRFRVLLERGQYDDTDLPPVSNTPNNLDTTRVPELVSTDPTDALEDLRVGHQATLNERNFVIQSFRDVGSSYNSKVIQFDMVVRVYGNEAFVGGKPSLPAIPVSATVTGSPDANRQPLVVIETSVTRGDLSNTLCQISTCEDTSGSTP